MEVSSFKGDVMIKIKLELTVKKKLNIGMGAISPKIEADVQLLSIRDFNGEKTFLIPGSTIKGILRTSLIRIAWLLGHENISNSINPESITGNDIVVNLFGKPHSKLPSKIYVDGALIKTSTEKLTHVRIDDRTGTAEKEALFSVEYLPIGEKIVTSIIARNLNLQEARALLATILNLRYERIGKAGIVDVRIIEAEGLDEYLQDPVVDLIYNSLRGG